MLNTTSSTEMLNDSRKSTMNSEEFFHSRNGNGVSQQKETPSKVIHLGFIIPTATEKEVYAVAVPFGRFDNFLFIRSKNQALIEFYELKSAIALIEYSRRRDLKIRNKLISVRYSTHQQIHTNRDDIDYFDICKTYEIKNAKAVLRASLDMVFAITYEDFENLFFQFGKIKKMVVFDKGGYTIALIEMFDVEAAVIARISLDGLNVFCESAIIKVEFSKTSELTIDPRNQRSRDYTINPQRKSDQADIQQIRKRKYEKIAQLERLQFSRDRYDSPPSPNYYDSVKTRDFTPPRTERTVILIDNLPKNITCDHLYNFVSYYGDIKRVKILFKKTSSALIQMMNETMAHQVVRYLNRVHFDGSDLTVKFSSYDSIMIPWKHLENFHLTKDYTEFPLKRYKRAGSKNFNHIYPPSPVLHLSNVSHLSHDDIKELFKKIASVEVNRVENLRNIKGQVLVGCKNITDAIYGIMKLHNYVLPNSSELKVSFSKGFENL